MQLILLEQLKLEVKGIHDIDQIADMISEALVNKRYLLLLDEVFLEINVKEVGIHDDHEHGAEVFAYRDRDFCRLMDDHIKIERLSNDDARYLFRKIVGDIIDRPSYKKIADRLIKECGGMPQVIKLTADGLRNDDDPSVWRQLLSDMQSPGTEPVQEMQELYKAFKLIYDKLPVDKKPCLFLINLRVLYLNNCGELMELPPQLEKLKSLEILDLRCTGILTLPEELAQLTGLKCLRVSFKQNFGCPNHINGKPKDLIPSNVIACLSSLQELSIDVDFKNQSWNQIVDRVAEEVASLKALTTERHLRFSAGEEDIPLALSKVLNKALSFELIGHHCAKNLSVFGTKYLKEVEACTVEECNEIESIIDGTINWCLVRILAKATPNQRPKTGDMIQLLCHLQDLQVEDCFEIKNIIEKGSIVQYDSLPRLKNMELRNLPKLFSVCEYNSFEWPSLEITKIKTCLELKDLPFSVENAPRLRVIECTTNWWNKLNDCAKDRLKDLHSFS
ncbi:disease resistance protein [Quercus suber]|uniref:Disease resistance protein n=1 Tax=Quercus suber TaxID=58331 RepID=A0AAW0J3I2_QUESU